MKEVKYATKVKRRTEKKKIQREGVTNSAVKMEIAGRKQERKQWLKDHPEAKDADVVRRNGDFVDLGAEAREYEKRTHEAHSLGYTPSYTSNVTRRSGSSVRSRGW